MPDAPLLSTERLAETTSTTIGHYDRSAVAFWEGTRDHDVSQNLDALFRHLPDESPLEVLDFGCGPGRDLIAIETRGHRATGLEGSREFVRMARRHSGCDVLHQDFLSLELPQARFDGIFANASIFHIPNQELPRVLRELATALKAGGVLFSSNPRGHDTEGWNGDRYGNYLCLETYRSALGNAGFEELEHYFRPAGRPRHEQPWLASVWRKPFEP